MYLPNAPQQMRSAPKLAMVNARIIFKQDNKKWSHSNTERRKVRKQGTSSLSSSSTVVERMRSGTARCGTLRRPTTESRSVKPLVKITYNFPRHAGAGMLLLGGSRSDGGAWRRICFVAYRSFAGKIDVKQRLGNWYKMSRWS